MDANFRLKLKERQLVDRPLGDGLAYYVPEGPYMAHIRASGEQTEVITDVLLSFLDSL